MDHTVSSKNLSAANAKPVYPSLRDTLFSKPHRLFSSEHKLSVLLTWEDWAEDVFPGGRGREKALGTRIGTNDIATAA